MKNLTHHTCWIWRMTKNDRTQQQEILLALLLKGIANMIFGSQTWHNKSWVFWLLSLCRIVFLKVLTVLWYSTPPLLRNQHPHLIYRCWGILSSYFCGCQCEKPINRYCNLVRVVFKWLSKVVTQLVLVFVFFSLSLQNGY